MAREWARALRHKSAGLSPRDSFDFHQESTTSRFLENTRTHLTFFCLLDLTGSTGLT